jgi:demethylmenaquinone methyltransferase / 2-methoxy-6-polyprenyl-1,4-benzoquinol methylase
MNPEKQAPLPGTRPAGARTEAEAGHHVQEMFSQIAPRYDFLNHALSLSTDRLWRRRVSRRFADILGGPDVIALDICCGTGDLTLSLNRVARRGTNGATVFGSDFALPMLELARRKNGGKQNSPEYFASDSLALPLDDSSADLVTAAFGFRNLSNYRRGLAEILRVLRPGGEVGILEFSEPRSGVLAALYRVYFKNILPRIGGAISGNAEAYAYLPASVARFPSPEELAAWMREAGFADVQFELWMAGAVAFHRGRKAAG